MQIRVATAGDADAIAALHTENWRSTYRGLLSDDYLDRLIVEERRTLWRQRMASPPANQHVIVGTEEGKIIGFSSMLGNEDEQWGNMLDNLHVVAQRKGQGLGVQLMRETAKWFQQNFPDKSMYLWVLEKNDAARGFYERHGASNEEAQIWSSPDGGALPVLRYVWHDFSALFP
jgi:GNAT superfamily N-acetyltransferase